MLGYALASGNPKQVDWFRKWVNKPPFAYVQIRDPVHLGWFCVCACVRVCVCVCVCLCVWLTDLCLCMRRTLSGLMWLWEERMPLGELTPWQPEGPNRSTPGTPCWDPTMYCSEYLHCPHHALKHFHTTLIDASQQILCKGITCLFVGTNKHEGGPNRNM